MFGSLDGSTQPICVIATDVITFQIPSSQLSVKAESKNLTMSGKVGYLHWLLHLISAVCCHAPVSASFSPPNLLDLQGLKPNLIAEIFTQFLSTRDASNSATDIVIRLLPNLSKILKDQRETLIQFAPSSFISRRNKPTC